MKIGSAFYKIKNDVMNYIPMPPPHDVTDVCWGYHVRWHLSIKVNMIWRESFTIRRVVLLSVFIGKSSQDE